MIDRRPKYQVALYLRGHALDPNYITSVLGIQPSKAHAKGEEKHTPTKQKYFTKIGLWSLASKKSGELSDLVDELSSQVASCKGSLANLDGVQDAYIDVFVAVDANDDGGGTWEAELGAESIERLVGLGISVRFTAAVVRE